MNASNSELCNGCSACANVCLKDAIAMRLNAEGFFQPTIDLSRCTHCGLCVTVCQLKRKTVSEGKGFPQCVYSAYAKDNEKRKSGSSGGIFGLIAARCIEEDGIVFGAAFDKGKQAVVCTNSDIIELKHIMRSKYVQSEIGHAYRQVKHNLQIGRRVVFSGTPCQVAGLKSYLNREYDTLLCVDFICHGVPSIRFFQDTLRAEGNKAGLPITDVRFREKVYGWRKQTMVFKVDGQSDIIYTSEQYPYYFAFLYSYSLGKQCFNCKFTSQHFSDITLADYWSIPSEQDTDEGASIVAVNTDKGAENIQKLDDAILQNIDVGIYEPLLAGHTSRLYDIKRRDRFFSYYLKYGYDKTVSKYLPNSYAMLTRYEKLRCKAVMLIKRLFNYN